MTEAQTIAALQANIAELTAELGRLRAENKRLLKELADANSLFEMADTVVVGLQKELEDAFNPPFVNKAQEPRA